jgi:hypothetical protein
MKLPQLNRDGFVILFGCYMKSPISLCTLRNAANAFLKKTSEVLLHITLPKRLSCHRDKINLRTSLRQLSSRLFDDLCKQTWTPSIPEIAAHPAHELSIIPLQPIVVEVKPELVLVARNRDRGGLHGLIRAVIDGQWPFVVAELEDCLVYVARGVQGCNGVLVGEECGGSETCTRVVRCEEEVVLLGAEVLGRVGFDFGLEIEVGGRTTGTLLKQWRGRTEAGDGGEGGKHKYQLHLVYGGCYSRRGSWSDGAWLDVD